MLKNSITTNLLIFSIAIYVLFVSAYLMIMDILDIPLFGVNLSKPTIVLFISVGMFITYCLNMISLIKKDN